MKTTLLALVCALVAGMANAFVFPSVGSRVASSRASASLHAPAVSSLSRPCGGGAFVARHLPASTVARTTITTTTTMGLFGLGAPEVAVILVVAAVVLGPDNLSGFAKDVGKMAGELKDVPKEFQTGIEEGEAEAQSRKQEIIDELMQKKAEVAALEAEASEGEQPSKAEE